MRERLGLHGPVVLVEKLAAVELEVTLIVTAALAGCESLRVIGPDAAPAVTVCGEVANASAGCATQR
ncbi:MAG TPA: hypothetical protein VE753_04525 [Gaiellaceae bacterium]|nr:hypothetical protein [Gaiellaceae bacterium]